MLKTIGNRFMRYEYDPANVRHRRAFAKFIAENRWDTTCPFFLEEPYADIVTMCLNKTMKYYMSKDRTLKLEKDTADNVN